MAPPHPAKYYWVQPAVLVQWDPKADTQRVWFIELLPKQEAELIPQIPTLAPLRNRHLNPYLWHGLFATAVLSMYTDSFWYLRDIVRGVEKVRVTFSSALASLVFLALLRFLPLLSLLSFLSLLIA